MTTILVVEDEGALAQMRRLVLEEEGYGVVLAASGPAGWTALSTERTDLVRSDVAGAERERVGGADAGGPGAGGSASAADECGGGA